MDRSSILLLIVALLGPLLSSSPNLLAALMGAFKSPAASAFNTAEAAPRPQGPPAPLIAPPRLDSLHLPNKTLKALPSSPIGTAHFQFPVILKASGKSTLPSIVITSQWFSQSTYSWHPLSLVWGTPPFQDGDMGRFSIARATLKIPVKDSGPGFVRFEYCFKAPPVAAGKPKEESSCNFSEEPLEAVSDQKPPVTEAKNEDLLRLPVWFSFGCLAVGSLALFWGKKGQPLAFDSLRGAPFRWNVKDTWLANLNAGTAIVTSFGSLGVSAALLSPFAAPQEYAAWSAIYVLCSGLSVTVFALCKVPDAAGTADTGSLTGFYLANGLNLIGVGGQLLLAKYALGILGESGVLAAGPGIWVSYVPHFLAALTVFYVAVRFRLLAASVPVPLNNASAPPANEGML